MVAPLDDHTCMIVVACFSAYLFVSLILRRRGNGYPVKPMTDLENRKDRFIILSTEETLSKTYEVLENGGESYRIVNFVPSA